VFLRNPHAEAGAQHMRGLWQGFGVQGQRMHLDQENAQLQPVATPRRR